MRLCISACGPLGEREKALRVANERVVNGQTAK